MLVLLRRPSPECGDSSTEAEGKMNQLPPELTKLICLPPSTLFFFFLPPKGYVPQTPAWHRGGILLPFLQAVTQQVIWWRPGGINCLLEAK